MTCEYCNDTGWYVDNGPGIRGNAEYQPCDQCAKGRAIEQAERPLETRQADEIAALKDALRGLQSEVDMLRNELADANVAIGLLRADLMTNLEAVAEAIEPLREQWPEAFEAANLNP